MTSGLTLGDPVAPINLSGYCSVATVHLPHILAEPVRRRNPNGFQRVQAGREGCAMTGGCRRRSENAPQVPETSNEGPGRDWVARVASGSEWSSRTNSRWSSASPFAGDVMDDVGGLGKTPEGAGTRCWPQEIGGRWGLRSRMTSTVGQWFTGVAPASAYIRAGGWFSDDHKEQERV